MDVSPTFLRPAPTTPLLGSPFTCGFWQPNRKYLSPDVPSRCTSSQEDQDENLILALSPEVYHDGSFYDEVLGAMRLLSHRLDCLLLDTKKMRIEILTITQQFKVSIGTNGTIM